jgi:pumilio family protein 6
MLKDLILNHSFSRIIQTLLKHSSSSQREYIAQQLEGSYKQLSESRYSRFLVCKIMKLVSAERRWKIMDEFSGSVVGMVRHKEAGKVLADAFEVHAGEWERAVLVSGLFGKEVALFGGFGFRDRSEEARTKAKRGLKGLLEGLDAGKTKRILGSMKENLMTMQASSLPFQMSC